MDLNKVTFKRKDIPGNIGIWAAILAEMSEFAIMFMVYLFPEQIAVWSRLD